MKLTSKINTNIDPLFSADADSIIPAQANLPSVSMYEKMLQEQVTQMRLDKMDAQTSHYAAMAYGAVYTKVSQKLKSIIKAVDSVRSFYLVDVMLSQLSEDALSPSAGSEGILRFSHPNKQIQEELDDMHKRIGLDQLIENIAPDILAYGEYTLETKIEAPVQGQAVDQLGKKAGKKYRIKKARKGLVDVLDIVDQGTVISLTQNGTLDGYLVLDANGRIAIREKADFIKFSLGGQRVRVDMKEHLPSGGNYSAHLKNIIGSIPRFIRVGKSVLYPVLEKLKELELLEKLIPATKINKLSQGNLVGMNIPESFDLETAQTAVKKIEGMVNRKVAVDPNTQEITVESILSTSGKTKIIPLFGEKGTLSQMDYKSDESDSLLSDTKEIRELILDSIGVPSELVFKSDGDSKTEILKRYAKYVRKLKRLQKAIAIGSKQMAYIHLANKGIAFNKDEVEVIFSNTLVEIDNLDSLEHADVTLGLLSNVKDFFMALMEEDSPFKGNVKLNKVLEYIEENLKTIGLADAIELEKEGGKDIDKDNPGDDVEPDEEDEPEDIDTEDGKDLDKDKTKKADSEEEEEDED